MKSLKITSILFTMLALHTAPCFALSMQFIVTMPPVITEGSVAQFDVFGKGTGAQVFIVMLDNSGDAQEHRNLALRYRVEYFPHAGGVTRLYEGVSNLFVMAPFEQVPPISSKDFLKTRNHAVKASISVTVFQLPDTDPLKMQVLTTQVIPDGTVRYTMILEKDFTAIASQSSEHTIINASAVELLAPGAAPGGAVPVIDNPYPVFTWTSDIPPAIYGSGDVYRLRLYKAKSGESPAEALSRAPVLSAGTKIPQYKLEPAGYTLIPGAVYYWVVAGVVKGITTTEVLSGPFAFKMAKPVNPQVQEIIALLRQIYREDILEKIYDFDTEASIRMDGKTVTIDALRDLVKKIQAGEHAIKSTAVE